MKYLTIRSLATHPAEFLSVPALADHLQVDERTILRMIRDGELRATRAGRHWRIFTASAKARFSGVVSRETSSNGIELQ